MVVMRTSIRRLITTTVVAIAFGSSFLGAGAAGAACTASWNIVSTPNVGEPGGDFDNGLGSLAAVSASDIWAVGSEGIYGAQRNTLAVHWDGTRWTLASTPNGSNEVNFLIGAAAVASNNVWAVGYTATNPPEQSIAKTLIEHWTGSAWSVVSSPNPTPPLSGGPYSNQLYGVDAVSANDVWAVGQTTDFGAGQTLILHWNGTAWSAVPSPHPGTYSVLRSVSAVSANDVWAVGTYYNNGLQVTLMAHWNGTSWTQVASPNDGPFLQELFKVRAVSANDVWAVGYHLAVFGVNQVYQTSIFHWNGSTWSVVPSPDQNQENNYLWSVDGTAANDAWAVGFYDTGFELRSMTQHWDGSAWSIVPSPNQSDVIDELTDVVTLSGSDAWAVGQSAGFFTFQTLAMRLSQSCSGTGMHVASITPALARNNVRATVKVVDASGVALSGATVSLTINKPGGTQLLLSRATNRRGEAVFSGGAAVSGTYTFTVTNVVKSGQTYDPASNVETSDTLVVP
jgi:hypothetical protein